MLDGVIETQTAYLHDHYCHHVGSFGISMFEKDNVNEIVDKLDKEDFQVHVHAIGDAAITCALNAFQLAKENNPQKKNRHHIAHIQVPNPKDVKRFAELNVCANFQPFWAAPDEDMIHLTMPLLGERSAWQYPIKSMIDCGAVVGFGSDWFVSSLNPLYNIQVAVTRNLIEASPEPFLASERITLEQAVRAYTLGAAYINFLEHESGSITVGKAADIIVLDRNIFKKPVNEIHQAQVVATFVNGNLVYEKKN